MGKVRLQRYLYRFVAVGVRDGKKTLVVTVCWSKDSKSSLHLLICPHGARTFFDGDIYMDELFSNINRLFNTIDEFNPSEVQELIDLISNAISQIESLEIEEFRLQHFAFSELLHQQGYRCLPFLCVILEYGLSAVVNIPTYTGKEKSKTELGLDDFEGLLKRCILAQPSDGLRILTYKLPSLNPWTTELILPRVVEMLEYFALTPLEDEYLTADLASLGNLLGMSRELARQTGDLHKTYVQFEAALERIGRDGYQQLARDYAEEAIICARADGFPEYGHYCRFSLASFQQNPIDAAIHGCLLVAALSSRSQVPEDFKYRVLNAAFTFLRNSRFYDAATRVYHSIIGLDFLDNYAKQKIDTAYLNLLLKSNPKEALVAANNYAVDNLEKIKGFGNASAVPWLVLLSNLKLVFPNEFSSCSGLLILEQHIDATLPSQQAEVIRDGILPGRKNTKKLLIESLNKLHLTRNKNDHTHEINRLQPTAERLLETSLKTGDLEGILLAHRVMSDGSIAFELSKGLPQKALSRHDSSSVNQFKGKNELYFEHVKKQLLQHKEYRYLWLGFAGEKLYYVLHDDGRFIAHGTIPEIEKSKIFEWLQNNLPSFGFNDSPITNGPWVTREDIWRSESEEIRLNLPKLYLPNSAKPTLVFCDTVIACFPHNFIAEPTDGPLHQAICNPLSLDQYLCFESLKLDLSEISIWAPVELKDTAILLAHGRLLEHINSYKLIKSEGLIPHFERQTDIKAFICHGGRSENGGFTGLYPSDDKKYVSSAILGEGKVAILFICHGAHVSSDIYARSFQTLTKDLLMAGYETVIAPSWSLNVIIPGPWMEKFLESLKSGSNIVDACLHANNRIKSIYPVESAWAAMHVFGNPYLFAC